MVPPALSPYPPLARSSSACTTRSTLAQQDPRMQCQAKQRPNQNVGLIWHHNQTQVYTAESSVHSRLECTQQTPSAHSRLQVYTADYKCTQQTQVYTADSSVHSRLKSEHSIRIQNIDQKNQVSIEVFLHPDILKTDYSIYLLKRSFWLRLMVSNNIGSTGSATLPFSTTLLQNEVL